MTIGRSTPILDYNITNNEVGWKIARVIRGSPDVYGAPRIIGMSGTIDFDNVDPVEFSKDYFDSFLPKPFELSTLRMLVDHLIGV